MVYIHGTEVRLVPMTNLSLKDEICNPIILPLEKIVECGKQLDKDDSPKIQG
jgi:hypothetical protein